MHKGEICLQKLMNNKPQNTYQIVTSISSWKQHIWVYIWIKMIIVNTLFPTKHTYHDTNQADRAREQNLRWEATVIGELKRKYDC